MIFISTYAFAVGLVLLMFPMMGDLTRPERLRALLAVRVALECCFALSLIFGLIAYGVMARVHTVFLMGSVLLYGYLSVIPRRPLSGPVITLGFYLVVFTSLGLIFSVRHVLFYSTGGN